jgi:hypothetical protein
MSFLFLGAKDKITRVVFRKAPPANFTGRFMPYFLSDRLVSEGALRSSIGCYHHVARSRSMVKSVSGECHGSQDLRTGNGGSSLYGKVELAW